MISGEWFRCHQKKQDAGGAVLCIHRNLEWGSIQMRKMEQKKGRASLDPFSAPFIFPGGEPVRQVR